MILYILIGLFLLCVVISFISFKIKISFIKKEDEDNPKLSIIALSGLIKREIIIPYKDIMYDLEKETFEKSNSKLKTKEKSDNKESIFSKLDNYKKKYMNTKKYYNALYPPIHDFLTKQIKIKDFKWITHMGCNDAGATALLSGVLWMIKGKIVSFLKNIFVSDNTKINIVPIFNNSVFKTDLTCIIHIKIGYIITTLIKIAYLLILKGGELNDKSSN